jgi:hypothetical protein
MVRCSFFAAIVPKEQSPQHGNPEGEGSPEEILQERRALLNPFVHRVGLGLLRRHHSADVFQEIHSTFFAGSALALLMPARRALIAKGSVTARAKARHQAHRRSALRALRHGLRSRGQGIARRTARLSERGAVHTGILPGRELRGESTGPPCVLGVNPDLSDRAFIWQLIETMVDGSAVIHCRWNCH